MYTYKTVVKLHDTDAAGLIFFSNQFKMVHEAYETLLESIGLGFATLIRKKDYFLPIVHAEADYQRPLFVGDRLVISVAVEHIGKTSFTFTYTLKRDSELVGTAKTVHVTVDKKTKKKIPLPREMRKAVELIQKN